MPKLYNFGAGPAKLPEEVYDVLAKELRDFESSGLSLLETSHRSAVYEKFNAQVQDTVRELLEVPSNYKILFLQGGGQGLFAGVPLNLMSRTGTADYVVTGIWSKVAAKEASKYGKVNYVLPEPEVYVGIPDEATWNLDPNASYVHICANDTIHGIEFNFIPDTKGVPLVADMSSNIMTRKFDVRKFGVIYACAQKNMGTAGVTLVIVREDLFGHALPICPSVFDWTLMAKNNSILNTPPVNAIQIMGRVLRLYVQQGGLTKMAELMTKKSSTVYSVIDQSNDFYSSATARKDRSVVNIPFRVGTPVCEELEEKFLQGAEDLGMVQLNGHKLVGGIRVSLYNSVTMQDVEVLVNYMKDFYEKHRLEFYVCSCTKK